MSRAPAICAPRIRRNDIATAQYHAGIRAIMLWSDPMKSARVFSLLCCLSMLLPRTYAEPAPATPPAAPEDSGIRFSCAPDRLRALSSGMDAYLRALKIDTGLVLKKSDPANGVLLYTLNTPADDFNTLDFKDRRILHIHDDVITLPGKHGHSKKISTVSKKEIVLALLQHGRLTNLTGKTCDIDALKDHVAIRQNTVAWAENLSWVWPGGDAAQWNETYWIEVYQWRNGVFSRSRDFKKIKPLTAADVARLSKRPSEGGLLKSVRVSPYFFSYEELPVWVAPQDASGASEQPGKIIARPPSPPERRSVW